jgi:hypothetical protein
VRFNLHNSMLTVVLLDFYACAVNCHMPAADTTLTLTICIRNM